MARPQQHWELFEENEVNAQFHEGQVMRFRSALLDGKQAQGVITKRYKNSCMIDFSACPKISQAAKEELNSKIVISYQALEPLTGTDD
ncbi:MULTISPECIES: hypothetical protein [Lacticaseibacillus]|uniref:Uncharacterized protein n=2 Tax=Lacticaseibacillus TaxID=2759736 RepID=A0ABW4CIP4_9LACO|nr:MULTISPECIES: hypothetical protein [Lacticaseibacillus]